MSGTRIDPQTRLARLVLAAAIGTLAASTALAQGETSTALAQGETSTGGVSNNNAQRSFSMGMTEFMALSQTSGLKVTYGQTISANASGADGSMIRAVRVTTF